MYEQGARGVELAAAGEALEGVGWNGDVGGEEGKGGGVSVDGV